MLLAALIAAAAMGSGAQQPAVAGSWVGTYSLHGPSSLTFSVQRSRGVVVLGVGHADTQTVAMSRRGQRIHFELPRRPTPLVFDGRLTGHVVRGSVRQGRARGTFRAHRGVAPGLVARGVYTSDGRALAVVDDPYGLARLVDLESGEVHGLYPSGKSFRIGDGFAERDPVAGTASFGTSGATIAGADAIRVATPQLEVRFASGTVMLSGTLTLPPGAGPHPAVAFVHGSGRTSRSYLPDVQELLVHSGVAVLAYDKRGIGQSAGEYPGESPTSATIDVLAQDAQAAARFLAGQPEIDPAHVGLAGHSQAGWIIPLAASREPAIRFSVVFSGPAVTADENDVYQDLAGEGERPQQFTEEQVDAEVLRRGPGGVDPIPWITRLHIPVFWLYRGLDKHIPSRLSVRRLEPLVGQPGRDFAVEVFPNANHALVETATGLTSEMPRSDRFAPGLFPRVAAWLRSHGL
jgi:dienelactone hydrolase